MAIEEVTANIERIEEVVGISIGVMKKIRHFGPKIAKLFIQWVREYDLHELNNTEKVGIPIDFQLGRVIIQTEGLKLDHPINTHTINQVILPIIFDDLGKTNGWKPEEISKSLWAIGSGGCGYKKHNICPFNSLCTKLISSFHYDKNGLFDPMDVGRYK